jgi:hypothetical protein
MRALANKFGAHLTFRQGESTGTIDLKQEMQPAGAPTIEIPAGAASALIDFNQACWNLFLRMSGINRAA